MKPYIPILSLLAVMAIAHFAVAVPLGMYESNFIWIDKPLHVLGGMLYALIGLQVFKNKLAGANRLTNNFIIVQYALLGSFLWELFELGYTTWFNSYALKFRFYSPTAQDALLDILFGILGGVIVMFWQKRN